MHCFSLLITNRNLLFVQKKSSQKITGMLVQDKFINKYREQFYTNDSISVQALAKQQKQLLKILDDLYAKTQKYFEKVCTAAEKKAQVGSTRNSFSKENNPKLPILVAEAELKNSQTYRQVLEIEKNRLEKRMALSMNLKEKDLNTEIKTEKEKVLSMLKNNKCQKMEIRKLGEKLIQQTKPLNQIYDQLLRQVNLKRTQNQQKRLKLSTNQSKITQLAQKLQESQYDLQQKLQQQPQPQPSQTQRAQNHKTLQSTRSKLQQSIQSLKGRLHQEYYCKLKQLENLLSKNQQVEEEISRLQARLEEKYKEMRDSKLGK